MRYPILAHVDSPLVIEETITTGWELFKNSWHWDPWAIGGVGGALTGYFLLTRFQWNKQALLFTLGNSAILLALVSPIATIGETYLFSVHMVQHLLLEIVAVPLIILGIPPKVAAYFLRWRPLREIANVLRIPVIAWLIGIGTLWVWHWPILYNMALENRTIHLLEHACFIISATIFWAALLDPVEKYRLKMIPAFVYLFTAALINTLLAILLTFAPAGLYPYYLNPRDPLGALNLIRNQWGIDPQMDQEMGGAVMWVLGGIVFTLVLIVILARWYQSPEEEHYDGIPNTN